MHNLSNTSRKRIEGIHEDLIKLIEISIRYSPYDFGIPQNGGLRTTEDQQGLYAIGRTKEKSRGVVTYLDGVDKKSYHQTGMAFDIFLYDEHGACWKCIYKYKKIAEHIFIMFDFMSKCGKFEGYKLEWGGNWNNPDYPHFQIVKE